jgi:hypothetical protein
VSEERQLAIVSLVYLTLLSRTVAVHNQSHNLVVRLLVLARKGNTGRNLLFWRPCQQRYIPVGYRWQTNRTGTEAPKIPYPPRRDLLK